MQFRSHMRTLEAAYGVVLFQVLCCILFCISANFSNQNDALSFWVLQEHLQAVNEVSAIKRVSTDTWEKWHFIQDFSALNTFCSLDRFIIMDDWWLVSHTNAQRLAQTHLGRLMYSFIRKGARSRYNAWERKKKKKNNRSKIKINCNFFYNVICVVKWTYLVQLSIWLKKLGLTI